MRVCARNIYHCLVHAHISYDRTSLPPHDDGASVVAKAAVEAVGVADRDDGYQPVFVEHGVSSISDSFSCPHYLQAEDGSLQGADCFEGCACKGNPVESYSESAHIELVLRESLYSGGVAYVFKDGVS